MKTYQKDFLDFAIDSKVLCFGEFTLKSGRISPYFFNAGLFQSGSALSKLGAFYADAIVDAGLEFDMLFGPAYKGIPLVAVTAAALYERHGRDYPYAFNRKEAKTHGEGGNIVGAELNGRVLAVDDVMTAGTAIREAVEIIEHHGAEFAGVAISLDRQEKGTGELSAVQQVQQDYKADVVSIVSLSDVVAHISSSLDDEAILAKINNYRKHYGVE